MSYELGNATKVDWRTSGRRRPFPGRRPIGRALARRGYAMMMMRRARRRAAISGMLIPSPPLLPLGGGLGFSLKPPKRLRRMLKPPRFIRKLQPGKVLKKIAIPLAIGAAALAIPGAAPLLLKGAGFLGRGALAAGKFAGSKLLLGGRGAGRLLGRFGSRAAGKVVGIIEDAVLPDAVPTTTPQLEVPVSPPIQWEAPGIPSAVPQFQPMQAGGAGVPGYETGVSPEEPTPEQERLRGAVNAMPIGLLVVGGLVLAGLAAGARRRR